jgi:hypothetical protein
MNVPRKGRFPRLSNIYLEQICVAITGTQAAVVDVVRLGRV